MPVVSNQKVTTLPAGLEITAGNISGLETTGRKGKNEAVEQLYETVWAGGGVREMMYANPLEEATGQTIKVASDAPQDNAGGSGAARRVRIKGLGPNGVYQEENIDMNGTTQVESNLFWTMVDQIQVNKTGSGGGTNYGIITAYANDGTTPLAVITVGEGFGGGAFTTCGAGKALYITGFNASAIGEAEVSIFYNKGGRGWAQRQTTFLKDSAQYYSSQSPIRLEAGDSIEIRARALTSPEGAKVVAVLEIVVEDN